MSLKWKLFLFLLCVPLGVGIPLSSFYSYGSDYNDSSLGASDDGSSVVVLPSPFMFFGRSYSSLYVSMSCTLYITCIS